MCTRAHVSRGTRPAHPSRGCGQLRPGGGVSCAQQANTAPIWWQMSRISPRTCHLLVERHKLARLKQFLELAGGLLKVISRDVHPPGVAVCPPGVAVCKYEPRLGCRCGQEAQVPALLSVPVLPAWSVPRLFGGFPLFFLPPRPHSPASSPHLGVCGWGLGEMWERADDSERR